MVQWASILLFSTTNKLIKVKIQLFNYGIETRFHLYYDIITGVINVMGKIPAEEGAPYRFIILAQQARGSSELR